MPKTAEKPKTGKRLSLWPMTFEEALRKALTGGRPEKKRAARKQG
jgi:hypothetical protein